MRKYTISILLFLSAFIPKLCAQTSPETASAKQETVIPFHLTDHNNIAVQGILNRTDTVNFMVHTAANAVTLTEEALKKIKSLRFDRTDSVSSWGGGGNTSRFSKSNTLEIGGLKWENVPIWENKNSGPDTDGKIGMDLFANQVIEFDFEKQELTLRSSLPNKISSYEKVPLIFENDYMFLEASVIIGNQSFKQHFLVHSGYSGAVLLDDAFAQKNKISEALTVVDEKNLTDSFGNVVKTKKAILPLFQLGKKQLSNVPVGFFEGAIGRQKMSVLGGDLLKRFNLIIDAQRTFAYLKPNNLLQMVYAK
jgi:hypothetical protein